MMNEHTRSQLDEKWGEAAGAGWQAVPDVLLKYQGKLGLSATDLAVLLNVLSFWWYASELPFPRAATIARRMSVTDRTVQRSLVSLQKKGFLVRKKDVSPSGDERDVLDPSGLVRLLEAYAISDPAYLHRHTKGGQNGRTIG